jgi:valyl-tRNA synthetase
MKLAQVSGLDFVPFADRDNAGQYANLAWSSVGPTDVVVQYEAQIDVAAERDRLNKDIAKFEKGLASAERQLGNDGFLAKAPAHIVEGLKKQESETRVLLEKARAALNALPPE